VEANSQPMKTSRVSASGRFLLFRSTRPITGFANDGRPELYRYDSVTGRLDCVSCNTLAGRTTGQGGELGTVAPSGQAVYGNLHLPGVLSKDGERVFFQTDEALLPSDTNGHVDVYAWEAGRLSLISSGQAQTDSYFSDATPSGDDVFFATRQQLVAQDTDQNIDIYDARAEGGIAAQNPVPPPPPCSGDSCRTGVTAPPPASSPASAGVMGPGNPKAAKPKPKKHKKQKHKKHKSKKQKHKKKSKASKKNTKKKGSR
jgi:hypothetical protein